ncbi:MAG: helix-turn-helix domain-containing protein [Bacteroidaceae bacterium]
MIHVNLKELRLAHKLQQSDISSVMGCTQSFVSRMERLGYDLDDQQYRKLADHFGEDEVRRYVCENKEQLERKHRVYRDLGGRGGDLSIYSLAKTIRNQQDEITRLNARVAELTDLLLNKK